MDRKNKTFISKRCQFSIFMLQQLCILKRQSLFSFVEMMCNILLHSDFFETTIVFQTPLFEWYCILIDNLLPLGVKA